MAVQFAKVAIDTHVPAPARRWRRSVWRAGDLAMLAAIRRALLRVCRFAADRRPGSLSKYT